MPNYVYIIAACAIILIVLGLIMFIRIMRFSPNPDKEEQARQLNDDLRPVGFAYDYKNDYFYALKNCWQREAGYCRLYDEGAPLFNMIIDCEPITFSYGGKRWLVELWKGQYGITTGAEIGIYNTVAEDVRSERFTGTFYEPVDDSEQVEMAFILYKNGKKLLERKSLHWWLTAFKLGEFSEKDELIMDARIKFPNRIMCKSFTDALITAGYGRKEFAVHGRTVSVRYTTPHTPQPAMQTGLHESSVQLANKTNCKAYSIATARYSDTLDKLEYARASMPELYDLMLRSLYAKEFFKAFEWLIELVRGKKPPHKPEPPCEPMPPCEPEPPCEPMPSCDCCEHICDCCGCGKDD